MDGQRKYEVIKKLVDENGSKDRAAMTLNISRRHVNRLIKAYLEKGRAAIVELYHAKYYDANFTHFSELLESCENISVSVGTTASILEAEYILSPKVTRAKKKRIAKELRQKQDAAKTQREKDAIQKNIVAVEDAHTRRPDALISVN